MIKAGSPAAMLTAERGALRVGAYAAVGSVRAATAGAEIIDSIILALS